MSATARDLLLLLRLRVRLLGRGRRGKGAGNSRLVLRVAVLGVLLLLACFWLARLLGQVLSGAVGRVLLPPLLVWVSSLGMILLFLLAVPAVLAAFTYSSDLKLLLLTPLSPRLLMTEKYLLVYGGLALPFLAVGSVVLISVGGAIGLGLGYDLAAVLALMLLAATPLALAMLLTVSVLRWVPPARARNIVAFAGAFFGIAAYLGSQLLGGRVAQRAANLRATVAHSADAWWSNLPTTWPGRALAAVATGDGGSALLYFAATAALALLLAALAIAFSARLFATGWATYQEVGRRKPANASPARDAAARRPFWSAAAGGATSAAVGAQGGNAAAAGLPSATATTAEAMSATATTDPTAAPVVAPVTPATASSPAVPLASAIAARLPWWPLVGKEWRTLRRDPRLWARLLYPLVVMLFSFYRSISQSTLAGVAGDSGVALFNVGWFYGTLAFITWILLSSLALAIVNREGRALYLLALAPLSAREVIAAKWTFCVLPVLALAETLGLAGALILQLSAGVILLGALLLAGLAVELSGAAIMTSLIWPRLDWDTPRQQVSGTASIVGALGGLALTAGTGALFILTLAWSSGQPLAALATGAALVVVPAAISLGVLALAPPRLQHLMTG